MSKRRKYKKRRASEKERIEKQEISLSPETRHSIFIIFIFTLAILSLLSLFDLAGRIGGYFILGLSNFFGWGAWLFPIILILLGILLLKSDKHTLKIHHYLGFFFLLLSYSGFFQLILWKWIGGYKDWTRGGGYLGYFIANPLRNIMGFGASFIILFALFIISILIIFETSLDKLINQNLKKFFNKISLILKRVPKEEIKFFNKEDEDYFSEKTLEENLVPKFSTVSIKEKKEQHQIFSQDKPIRKKIDIPLDILNKTDSRPISSGDVEANKNIIQKTLENFSIPVEMGEINVGPTVTQYTLKPTEGVKLSQITTLSNDLALALAAHPIRIEAPIPGKSLVGIEVPNKSIAIVTLREILESKSFKNRKSHLTLVLGRDVAGCSYLADLDKAPHLLVAGATGSGKTVCLNSIIISLLYQNSPQDLKFILIDPKRVELTVYEDIPHLLTPVITDVYKTINALKWSISEMERRFELFVQQGVKDIKEYNQGAEDKIPYIVIVIDELADLMSMAASEFEACIIRLAQMSRATGIHLVMATQRPSVDIITGLIKANITSRIAFSVASSTDSRTILDISGAEKLLGRGDMLYVSAQLSKPVRLQGAFVSNQAIKDLAKYLKKVAQPEYLSEVTQIRVGSFHSDGFIESDELLPQAKEIIWRIGRASASLLQRRLRIGYARAARLLDLLEEEGIIGPIDGAKPREILIQREGALEENREEEKKENNDEIIN